MFGLGSGRLVRIPPPPRRAGFKQRADYYHKRKGGPPRDLPAKLRLRGKPRTRGLRSDLRRRAGLMRSPWRWAALLGAWSVLGYAALTVPFERMSALHLVLGVSAFVAWPAAFALSPVNRAVAGLLLLVGAVLIAVCEGPLPVTALVAVSALTFILGGIELAPRTGRKGRV